MEVNLNKPLKGSVMINGERYYVSYEGISTICSTCGMYGHLVHACPKNVTNRVPTPTPSRVITNHESTEATGMDAEFTQVRQARRKPEQPRHIEGLAQNKDGRGMVGSKEREVRNGGGTVEEVRVSNRFGSLEEEGDKEEIGEDVGRVDENKENENTMNLSSGELSKVHGKAILFSATKKVRPFAVTENQGNQPIIRLGPKEKKESNMRSLKLQKPKPKHVGTTRGLFYGPARGEIELLVSGKRLRIEKESVGRPGGAFTGDRDLDENEK